MSFMNLHSHINLILMKSLLFILFIGIFAFSCKEDQEPLGEFPQFWEIAGWQSYRSFVNTGFQAISDSSHTYLFKRDGTFLKTVGTESISGTYQTEVLIYEMGDKRINYHLFFPEDKLRNSCFANRENLYINENGMLVGGSAPCDGPAVFFKLVR
jgi:hypothetical protein